MTEEKAKERIKSLEKQVHLYREAIRYYRDELNEARDEAAVLSYALDMFTYHHPEHADEIKSLIELSTNIMEDEE